MKGQLQALLVAGMLAVPILASAQSAAPAPSPRTGDIIVEPTPERPKPPDGDPRSNEQRREDRAAFDKCLLSRQGRPEEILSNPGLPPDPLLYCQQSLGMANAYDVPKQRREKQR